MLARIPLAVVVLVVTTVLLVSVVGCTIHFKGKDVELDTHANVTYELRSIGVFDGQNR